MPAIPDRHFYLSFYFTHKHKSGGVACVRLSSVPRERSGVAAARKWRFYFMGRISKLGSVTSTLIPIQFLFFPLFFWSPVILEAEDYSAPAASLPPPLPPPPIHLHAAANVVAADRGEMRRRRCSRQREMRRFRQQMKESGGGGPPSSSLRHYCRLSFFSPPTVSLL